MTASAALSSAATALDELISRIGEVADGLTGHERDALGSELFEVERTLASARRRLVRALAEARL